MNHTNVTIYHHLSPIKKVKAAPTSPLAASSACRLRASWRNPIAANCASDSGVATAGGGGGASAAIGGAGGGEVQLANCSEFTKACPSPHRADRTKSKMCRCNSGGNLNCDAHATLLPLASSTPLPPLPAMLLLTAFVLLRTSLLRSHANTDAWPRAGLLRPL